MSESKTVVSLQSPSVKDGKINRWRVLKLVITPLKFIVKRANELNNDNRSPVTKPIVKGIAGFLCRSDEELKAIPP